jgi:HemY protein
MLRIVLFLLLIALAAAGAAWIADQHGEVVLTWEGLRVRTSLPVFALGLGLSIAAGVLTWILLGTAYKTPGRIQRARRERRHARGRHAITHGLLAIGHGDATVARQHADTARRLAGHDPLALLLHAQTAQLEGDRVGAHAAFRSMAEREDTRLLGLRGLFIEAQRADDLVGAVMVAEEALKLSPSSTWASHAVLGFRCAKGDWAGALSILDNDLASGRIDKQAYRRRRGVLLTARALELEKLDRDLSRECVMEAIKLAPTLVPAAALAAKFESEAHQVRRAMRIVETAWLSQPHPDLADAYAHVRLGDSARQRLVRVETLAAKTQGNIEGALAVARAAIDASEFARAREALAPFTAQPTQRVAMLMAEIERTEHGDSGKARTWTLRAVRARHDPAWTADGYVSERWRPVSPVTGRLDAFQWQTPVASLPAEQGTTIESSPFEEAMLAAPSPRRPEPVAREGLAEPPREIAQAGPEEVKPDQAGPEPVKLAEVKPDEVKAEVKPASATMQDNAPPPAVPPVEKAPEPVVAPPPPAAVTPAPAPSPPAATPPQAASPAPELAPSQPAPPQPSPSPAEATPAAAPAGPAPLFRTRSDLGGRLTRAPVPAVIPIQRAPDDPGVEGEEEVPVVDEFAEQMGTPKAQAGGWRGFLSRWGG